MKRRNKSPPRFDATRWLCACALLAAGAHHGITGAATAGAQKVAALPKDLTELSLDDLLNIEVTSVTKRAQKAYASAAAVTVITGDEIRRMGTRSIVEALRRVPGFQVARTSTNSYTVLSRGFAADKLEVLMDGRSLYSPLNSTVFWDVLDTYLPDIDRIEIIRGPGGTLYGANAMNGVINIITRNAAETTGTEVLAGAGDEEHAFGGVSTGSAIGERGHARLFVKAFERDSSVQADGSEAYDGTRQGHAGFRGDWSLGRGHTLNVAGGLYDAVQDAKAVSTDDRVETDRAGGHVQAGWRKSLVGGGHVLVAGYYDRYKFQIPEVFDETRDTYQLALEHDLPLGERHHLVWGLGYRSSHDETGGPPNAVILTPESRTVDLASAFVQDQWRLGRNVELTLGSKFEYNDFTGFEVQPGVRLGWQLTPVNFTWASVARAVRTPNRLDSDIAIFCSQALFDLGFCAPVNSNFRIGNPDLDSEKLIAYEWGYRYTFRNDVAADLSLFFNDYSEIRSTESTPPPFGSFDNRLEGESFGGEVSVAWFPWTWLELRPFYSYLELDLRAQPGSTDADTARQVEGNSAEQMAGLRFGLGPWWDTSATGFVRYVDQLPNQSVPHYTELNLRLAYRAMRGLAIAVVGENLLDESHPEFGTSATRAENQRSVFLEVHWIWQ